ncbi:MAG TPA: DUF1206 domain-containing protein [Ilumatobacteraceae bacterium]|nr:DUF1206 domain-containing protein [Ilumatobacteraceae bacterium]HRB01795.1 DUF1206 domain-containing protein [Ilumatobacteraceae bacterium]
MSITDALQKSLTQLRQHPGLIKFGRLGWFAKGVVYTVAGVLALVVTGKAAGWSQVEQTPTAEASPTGALRTIAQATGGALLMWLLAVGMIAYSAWRVVSALLPGGTDLMAWVKRIGYLVSAVIYVTFAITAISLARATEADTDGNAKVTSMSADVMAHTGGRIVIGLAGAIAIGAGIYRMAKGVKVDVTDELDLSGLSSQHRLWTKRLGAIGEFGRGLGIALIGFFLLRAAITYDRTEATGLDGALRRLSTHTWGQVIVVAIGLGFVAYGAFCLATFTRRRLQAP